MILHSGTVAGTGLGLLLDITLEDAILVSLQVMLSSGSGGHLGCGSLSEEPCVSVMSSLQKLLGAVCKERYSNGAL